MTSFEDTAARHLASQGLEKIEAFQSVVDRARQILKEEGLDALDPSPPTLVGRYAWEKTEVDPSADRIAHMATFEDQSTGQGLTAYFFATPCRDEDEMRRLLAPHIGHHLANAARIAPFSRPLSSASFFLSLKLADKFADHNDGKSQLGTLSFFGKYHINYG